jgi:hypothetical protein
MSRFLVKALAIINRFFKVSFSKIEKWRVCLRSQNSGRIEEDSTVMKFVHVNFEKAPLATGEVDEISKLIRQRLEHVEMIFELRHQFHDRRLVQYVGDNGWTHPWRYFDALMYTSC